MSDESPADAGPTRPRSSIPTPLLVTSEVCARLLVIAAATALFIYLIVLLRVVVIPVAIALLLTALLAPVVRWLHIRRVPRGAATALVLVGGIAVLGGLLSFVINTFIGGFPALQAQITVSLTSIEQLLAGPPFNVRTGWLQDLPDRIAAAINDNRDALTTGALTTATTVGEVAAGTALALFSLIFFLYDGRQIWQFMLRGVPRARRDRVDVAGRRAFAALVGYVRAAVLVAIVDGLGIGLGLLLVGSQLYVPLAALVFLAAFIPAVGAVLTGGLAVLITLLTNGPVPALILLVVVIAVLQVEANVLQPLLLGRAVRLHALAVVLVVASGVVVSGVVGALLAVPLLAVLNTALRSLTAAAEQSPTTVNALDPRQAQPATGKTLRTQPGRFARVFRRLVAASGSRLRSRPG